MDGILKSKTKAMIILHEIYGINEFIWEQCKQYRQMGFDVFCPNMLDRNPFPYTESEEAYRYYFQNVGFKQYAEIDAFVHVLKERYDKVFIIGFSVGATVAWRCSENPLCSGIIACYGSRIRDYMNINPACPALLLYAKNDSFDVPATVYQLKNKTNLTIEIFEAAHGFMDSHCISYNESQSKIADTIIERFISEFTK